MKSVRNITLGPGKGLSSNESPFILSAADWKKEDSLCSLIAASSDESVTYMCRYVPAFADLRDASLQWHNETFAQIIKIANLIFTYGTTTALTNYAKLMTHVKRFGNGQVPDSGIKEINEALQQCINQVDLIVNHVSSVVSDIKGLTHAVQTVRNECKPYTKSDGSLSLPLPGNGIPQPGSENFVLRIERLTLTITQISAAYTAIKNNPLQAMEQVQGDWMAIRSDLQFLKETVPKDINTVLPIMTELSIQEAMNEWKNVAEEAHHFVQFVQ